MEGIPCRPRPTAQVRRAGAGLSLGCCGSVGLGAVASALLPWSPGNRGDDNLVIAAPTELHTRHLSVPRSPDKTRSPLGTRRQGPGSRGHCPCVLVSDSGGLPCAHVPRTMGAGRASSLDAHVARWGTPDPEVTVSTESTSQRPLAFQTLRLLLGSVSGVDALWELAPLVQVLKYSGADAS